MKIIFAAFFILYIIYLNIIASFTISEYAFVVFNAVSFLFVAFTIYFIVKNASILKFVIIFILWIMFLNIPYINQLFKKDNCLDTSICKEGLEINTEYGLVKINKENCEQYGWKWYEDTKECNMKK